MITESECTVIRAQEPSDDAAVTSIFRANYPEFPHGTTEEYRASFESLRRHGRMFHRFVAEAGGEVVGHALLLEIVTTGSGQFWVEVQVPPGRRQRGTGGRLLERVLNESTSLHIHKLLGEVLDTSEDGKAFAEKHGFFPNQGHGEQMSRLDVQTANLHGFSDAEETLVAAGVRIERLAELNIEDEGLTHALYRLDMDTHRDVPSPVEWVDAPFDEWLERIVNGPGRSPQWSWAALDGEVPIGMARLRLYARETASPDGGGPDPAPAYVAADNAYTGVRSEYRSRGVARALKHRTVTWCRDHGIKYIYTGNSVQNQRMLAINRSLGYEVLPRTIEVVRELP